jgi:hypothetical protein
VTWGPGTRDRDGGGAQRESVGGRHGEGKLERALGAAWETREADMRPTPLGGGPPPPPPPPPRPPPPPPPPPVEQESRECHGVGDPGGEREVCT